VDFHALLFSFIISVIYVGHIASLSEERTTWSRQVRPSFTCLGMAAVAVPTNMFSRQLPRKEKCSLDKESPSLSILLRCWAHQILLVDIPSFFSYFAFRTSLISVEPYLSACPLPLLAIRTFYLQHLAMDVLQGSKHQRSAVSTSLLPFSWTV
jgi:hypothetical protein